MGKAKSSRLETRGRQLMTLGFATSQQQMITGTSSKSADKKELGLAFISSLTKVIVGNKKGRPFLQWLL